MLYNIKLTLQALDVDYKVALQKSKHMDISNPAVKDHINFLTRVTPNILPANTTQRQPANVVIQNVSATQVQPLNPVTNSGPSSIMNQSTSKESSSAQNPSAPSTSSTPSASCVASAEKRQLDSVQSMQSTSASQGKDISKQTGDKSVLGRGTKRKETEGKPDDELVEVKKSKAASSLTDKTKDNARNVNRKSTGNSEDSNKKGNNPIVDGRSSTSAANLNQPSMSHTSTANLSTIPAGTRIIKLPPGVKLKPGDKIQDILAAHGQATTSPQSQQAPASPQVSQGPSSGPQKQTIIVRKPTSSAKATGVSQSQGQKQSVVVIKPPTGMQDPNKVKILPPGAITTCAFKSLLLHRKYLMKKADELYKRQYYKVRGEELQRKINVEVAKQSGSMKVEEGISESALSAGALNETLHTTDKSIASYVAAKVVKTSDKNTVRHDALAKIRRTKDYKMLQKRFEALFAWPALLSTIHPENVDNVPDKKGNDNPTTTSQKGAKKRKYPKVSVRKGVPYVIMDRNELDQAVVEETQTKPVRKKKVT